MALKLVRLPYARLAPHAASSLARVIRDSKAAARINSSFRDVTEQARIFLDRYRESSGPNDKGPFGDRRGPYKGKWWKRVKGLPVAVPGTSKHNQGLAIDVSVGTALWTWLVKYGRRYGWIQTMPLTDPVHFEYVESRDEVRAEILRRRDNARRKVARVKAALGRLGWFASKPRRKDAQHILGVTPDGIYGPITKKAWKKLLAAAK